MIGPHYVIRGTLEVLSDLRIGTGDTMQVDGIGAEDGDLADIALVALDHAGNPYLPGSSLKGVLRRLAPEGTRELMFGPKKIDDPKKAKAGVLAIWNAWLDAVPSDQEMGAAPHGSKQPGDGFGPLKSRGLYVDSRTAIDGAKGVADSGKLFHQAMVAPGVQFAFEATLDHRRGGSAAAAVAELLAAMRADGGFRVGAGTRGGLGRIRLAGDLSVTAVGVRDDDSHAAAINAPAAVTGAASPTHTLVLRGDGPFFVSDASKAKKQNKLAGTQDDEENQDPQLQALLTADGKKPRLPGSSLLGALRARAVWLARLSNRSHEDDRMRVLRPGECPVKALSPTERLFGVAGWQGLVRIHAIECTKGEMATAAKNITSVKLDRFSNAPVDGGLFTVRSVLDPEFRVTLSLDARRDALTDEDKLLFAALLQDLKCEGLMLGHASNRGYGWFKVEDGGNVV